MRKLIVLAAILAMAGCAIPTYMAYKAGVTNTQYKIDNYECTQQSRSSYGGGGTGSVGITMIVIAKRRAERQSAELYKMCMEARGYTVTEVQQPPQEITGEKNEGSTQPQITSRGEPTNAHDVGEKKPQALPWIQRSYESLQKREWAEAIRTASVAISLDPNSAVSYANRAWAYSEKGFFDKALEDCDTALKLDPNSALAYNNRGLTYQKMGLIKESKDDYEKACNLGLELACNNFKAITGYSPLDKTAKANLLIKESQNRFEQKDWDEVIRISSEGIDLTPNNDLAYSIRAGAYANKGLFNEAINDCNSAIRINPDRALAYNNRGYAFERLGQVKEALLDYEISCRLGLELGCHNLKRLSGGK